MDEKEIREATVRIFEAYVDLLGGQPLAPSVSDFLLVRQQSINEIAMNMRPCNTMHELRPVIEPKKPVPEPKEPEPEPEQEPEPIEVNTQQRMTRTRKRTTVRNENTRLENVQISQQPKPEPLPESLYVKSSMPTNNAQVNQEVVSAQRNGFEILRQLKDPWN